MSSFAPRTAAANKPSAPTPASLTNALQRVPVGPSPLQHYAQKTQAFEQVALGQARQRKDMAMQMQTIMKGWDGSRR